MFPALHPADESTSRQAFLEACATRRAVQRSILGVVVSCSDPSTRVRVLAAHLLCSNFEFVTNERKQWNPRSGATLESRE